MFSSTALCKGPLLAWPIALCSKCCALFREGWNGEHKVLCMLCLAEMGRCHMASFTIAIREEAQPYNCLVTYVLLESKCQLLSGLQNCLEPRLHQASTFYIR